MSHAEPLSRFTIRRRVEFADTDMGGIVHFARYFVFVETAEHEFLRAIGTTVHQRRNGDEIGWPRVSATLEYLSPAGFGDELTIELRVRRKGASSLTYGFLLTVGDRPVAKGRVSTVCCVLNHPSGLKTIPIPREIAERIVEDDGD